MRLEPPRSRQGLAQRLIYVVEKIFRRITRIQAHCLAGINNRTATDTDKSVEIIVFGESDRCFKRAVAWFNLHTVKYRDLYALVSKGFHHRLQRLKLADLRISIKHHMPHTEMMCVRPDLGQGSGAKYFLVCLENNGVFALLTPLKVVLGRHCPSSPSFGSQGYSVFEIS